MKNRWLTIAILLSCSVVASAQIPLQYHLRSASYRLYDPGVYELSEYNDATDRGMGVGVTYYLARRVGLSLEGDYSVLNGLQYGSFTTQNASHFRLGANIDLLPIQSRRWNTALVIGYAYNHIAQLEEFGLQPQGVNINLGVGNTLRFTERMGLEYQVEYNFSLSNDLRYGFCQHVGVVWSPRSLEPMQEELEQIRAMNDSLQDLLVDCSIALESKRTATPLIQLDTTAPVIDDLDIIELVKYSYLNSEGRVVSRTDRPKLIGYYVGMPYITRLSTAVEWVGKAPFAGTSAHLLNKGEFFHVVTPVGHDLDEALEALDQMTPSNPLLRLYRF